MAEHSSIRLIRSRLQPSLAAVVALVLVGLMACSGETDAVVTGTADATSAFDASIGADAAPGPSPAVDPSECTATFGPAGECVVESDRSAISRLRVFWNDGIIDVPRKIRVSLSSERPSDFGAWSLQVARFDIEPSIPKFNSSAFVEITFDELRLETANWLGSPFVGLSVYNEVTHAWEAVPGITIEPRMPLLRVKLLHFSKYALTVYKLFEPVASKAPQMCQGRKLDPVLLVHGLQLGDVFGIADDPSAPTTFGALWNGASSLISAEADGAPTYMIRYDTTASIKASACALSQAIAKIRGNEAGARVSIVSHSMGGLVARAYAKGIGQTCVSTSWNPWADPTCTGCSPAPDPKALGKVITLATPHNGVPDLNALVANLLAMAIPECDAGEVASVGGGWLLSKLAEEVKTFGCQTLIDGALNAVEKGLAPSLKELQRADDGDNFINELNQGALAVLGGTEPQWLSVVANDDWVVTKTSANLKWTLDSHGANYDPKAVENEIALGRGHITGPGVADIQSASDSVYKSYICPFLGSLSCGCSVNCSPPKEVCKNGADDDCDGVVDDGCSGPPAAVPPTVKILTPQEASVVTDALPVQFTVKSNGAALTAVTTHVARWGTDGLFVNDSLEPIPSVFPVSTQYPTKLWPAGQYTVAVFAKNGSDVAGKDQVSFSHAIDTAGKLALCAPLNPPKDQVTCGYHGSPGCPTYTTHGGIDYGAGTKDLLVHAPASCIVTKVTKDISQMTCGVNNIGFGNHVVCAQGAFEIILAHLRQDVLVNEGDQLVAGDPVGYVSNTGNTMTSSGSCSATGGYHLHLEVRLKASEETVDPFGPTTEWQANCSILKDPQPNSCAGIDCNDGESCTEDSCANGKCSHMPIDGGYCVPSAGCSNAGSCKAGKCISSGGISCADGDPCTVDACNSTGKCDFSKKAAPGTPCDDGDACTESDACNVAGSCKGTAKLCDDGKPCTVDVCLPGQGCAATATPSGSCDDGEPCTTGDHCTASGECQGTLLACPQGVPCQVLACMNGACNPTPQSGGFCNDGDPCTYPDSCLGGVCNPGPTVPCDDGNPCSEDSCTSGACKSADTSGSCDDGNPCSSDDACIGGKCTGVKLGCDDGIPCTLDICNATGCVHTNSQAPCDDGDLCALGDACKNGACESGGFLSCDDGLPCTYDECANGKCAHKNGDGKCDDGNSCTENDICVGGVCQAGVAKPCDDGVPCTLDLCVEGKCAHTAVAGPCQDGDECTAGDSCADGACKPGKAMVCDDKNPCTTDVCVGGKCIVEVTGGGCDDGNPCTISDLCNGDVCAGVPKPCDDGNVCTIEACINGACTSVPTPAACSDGVACTIGDACLNGSCLAGAGMQCDDANPCTTDLCKDAKCVFSSLSGTPCDDGVSCTSADICTAGRCGGTYITCDDKNSCTQDWCGPTGCQHVSVPGPCEDGNSCTTGDACAPNGTCKAGDLVACPDDGNPCTTETCLSGACKETDLNTGGCDDGNPCTLGDHCEAGQCAAAPTEKSCDDGNVCTLDACDKNDSKICTHVPADGACTDGSSCTIGDYCEKSSCHSGATKSCDDGNPCTIDACADGACGSKNSVSGFACDDSNPCTEGDGCQSGVCAGVSKTCLPDSQSCTLEVCEKGSCVSVNIDGVQCEDGNACTGSDSCQGGACAAGAVVVCADDGNPCTVEACDANLGCGAKWANVGTPCSDADACTVGDACSQGKCLAVSMKDCSDGQACTTDTCTAGICAHVPNGAACEDGNACTIGDACVAGLCKSGVAKSCDDGIVCTVDSCAQDKGCSFLAVLDGVACSDGDGCTANDVCKSGVCTGGPIVICQDDNNACTSELCTGGKCSSTNLTGTACEDGNLCTGPDACSVGQCKSGPLVTCEDNNPCTADSCAAGNCAHVAAQAPCSDSDDCTVGDHCVNKICVGGGPTCPDDGKPCDKETCVSGTCGKVFLDYAACEDGKACTTADFCLGGICNSGNSTCTDFLDCTTDSCTPSGCVNQKLTGGPCADGDKCMTGATCNVGQCTGGTPKNCSAYNGPCQTGMCQSGVGTCYGAPKPNGTPCNDGDACTLTDQCSGGGCSSGPKLLCNDGIACTTDKCDSASGVCKYTPDNTACSDGIACSVDTCSPTSGCSYNSAACCWLQTETVDDGCAGSWIGSSGCKTNCSACSLTQFTAYNFEGCLDSSTNKLYTCIEAKSTWTGTLMVGRKPQGGALSDCTPSTINSASTAYAEWRFSQSLCGQCKIVAIIPTKASFANASLCPPTTMPVATDAKYMVCKGNTLALTPVQVNMSANAGTEVQLYQGDCTGIDRIVVPNSTSGAATTCSPVFLLDKIRADKL